MNLFHNITLKDYLMSCVTKSLIAAIAVLLFAAPFSYAGGSSERAAPVQTASSGSRMYTGDGGKGKSIAILAPQATGLANNQDRIPAVVQGEFVSNFSGFSAMSVLDRVNLPEQYAELLSGYYSDDAQEGLDLGHLFPTDYIMGGSITRTAAGYAMQIRITRSADKMTVASYSGICTFEELDNLSGVRRASMELLQKMGVNLTKQAREELSRAATSNEVSAQIALAKSGTAGATEFEKMYYTYQANRLDPTLAEAARRVAGYQTEIYKAPEVILAMPDIRTPEISAPQFKAPEIRMAATGNIGADARRQQEQYNAQREASRTRQEAGNRAMKDLQDAFLEQFRIQSEAVRKQQSDLLRQRDILIGQQKTLLERQRQMIAQLNETENSYDTFFNEHPPFEIIYDPAVKPIGNANLEKGTINMQFAISSVGTPAMEIIQRMLADFEKGLGTIAQGLIKINAELDKIEVLLAQVESAGNGALRQLVSDYAAQMAKVEEAENNYAAQLARLDTALKTTGYAQLGRDFAVRPDTSYAEGLARQYAVRPTRYSAAGDKTMGSRWELSKWNKDERRTFAIEANLENDAGKTIGKAYINLSNQIFAEAYTRPMSDSTFGVFNDVPVNDITDTLKVSIQRVNGRDVTAAANADYIKISPLEANGYTRDGWNIDGYNKSGRNQMGLTRRGTERPVRDEENAQRNAIWNEGVNESWGGGYFGFFIGGALNINPSGGLFEIGLEAGGKWFVGNFGLGLGGGSLKVDNEIVRKNLGSIDWKDPYVVNLGLGAAIPVNFPRARINLGGGLNFMLINVLEIVNETPAEGEGNGTTPRTLDMLFTPYVGARLDLALSQNQAQRGGGMLGYIGYRCEFLPTDKIVIYFKDPAFPRHTIYAGFIVRMIVL